MLTTRQLWLGVHLGLGILFVHAFAGGAATLVQPRPTRTRQWIRNLSTAALALAAWLTDITGTWVLRPWFRATPPPGEDHHAYPLAYLLSRPELVIWQRLGMEWKIHVGWLAPFLATAVAVVVIRHPQLVLRDPTVRKVVNAMFFLSLGAAMIAAGIGAMVNNVAPNDFLAR